MDLNSSANQCFVCGPDNPIGLNVAFNIEVLEGEPRCVGEFLPGSQHVGYEGVTHGGIVFSLLDDVMANWLWLQGEHSFTAKAEIRYRDELPVGTPIRLVGRCCKRKGRLALMESELIGQADEKLYAQATASFMLAQG